MRKLVLNNLNDLLLAIPIVLSSRVVTLYGRNMYFVEKGYDHYIVKGEEREVEEVKHALLNGLTLFVEKEGEKKIEPDNSELAFLEKLPSEVREELMSAGKEGARFYKEFKHVKINYIEVKPRIVKEKQGQKSYYILVDVEPKQGIRDVGEAIIMSVYWVGSGKYPKGKTAERKLKEWRIKYPENEILQKYMKAVQEDFKTSRIVVIIPKKPPETIAENLGLIEPKIESLEKEFEELLKQWGLPQENKNRTAVKEPKETPRPTTNTKEKVELSEEELERLVMNTILRRGLQPVKIIVFTLPTEYLRTKTKYQKDEDNNKIYEIKEFSFDPSTFRTLRRKFYDALHEIAWKSEVGWIAFHDADLSVIDKYIAELNRLVKERGIEDTRYIEVIDAYLPRDFMEKQLTLYIRERKASYQSILEKLNEEKLKAREVKRLRNELLELEQELKKLEKELKYLRSF